MRIDDRGERKRIILEPGEYHVSNQNVILSTLLGSCVSACLYDPVKRIFGMNHFLLSNKRYAKKTHKFGIEIPKNAERAYKIDKENGNTLWMPEFCRGCGACFPIISM